MTIAVTARPWEACKALARATWTRARATTHPALDHAADAAGLDRSHLSRWESERCDHPAPLAVLWSRALVSDEAFEALVTQARTDRSAQGAPADVAAPEDALVALLRRVSSVVGDGAVALRDGRLDPAELRALRPQVQDVGRGAARLLRAVDHVLGADTAKVVPLRGVR